MLSPTDVLEVYPCCPLVERMVKPPVGPVVSPAHVVGDRWSVPRSERPPP